MGRGRVVLAWLLMAVAVAGLASAAVWDTPPLASPSDIVWAVSFLAFPSVGLLLALKRPSNPVGWLFEIGPACVLWGLAMDERSRGASGGTLFALGLVVVLAAVLLFPDGRYPNRWFGGLHLLALAGLFVEPRVSPETDGGLSFGALVVLTAITLVYRAIVGDSTLRRQLLAPAFVAIVGVLGLFLLVGVAGIESDVLGNSLIILMLLGIPAAIAAAVLKYRLYDIDRIVSRTVTYGILSALVLLVYGVVVTLATRFLPLESDVAVAGATLAGAGAFQPLRRRVHRTIDRRFNRTRYVMATEFEAFVRAVRSRADLESVTTDLVTLVGRTLQPLSVDVWVRSEG